MSYAETDFNAEKPGIVFTGQRQLTETGRCILLPVWASVENALTTEVGASATEARPEQPAQEGVVNLSFTLASGPNQGPAVSRLL